MSLGEHIPETRTVEQLEISRWLRRNVYCFVHCVLLELIYKNRLQNSWSDEIVLTAWLSSRQDLDLLAEFWPGRGTGCGAVMLSTGDEHRSHWPPLVEVCLRLMCTLMNWELLTLSCSGFTLDDIKRNTFS